MNLRTLPNAIVKTVVEFRANLKENMDKANAGFPVVITRNDAVESVLVSPEMAQRLFEDGLAIPSLDPNAIDTEPLVTEFEVEVEVDDDEVDAPPAVVADVVGIESIPPVLPESSPVDEVESSPDEASAEVEDDSTPADASEELEHCPACVGQGEDHEVPSIEHPTEADIPADAEIISEGEVESRAEEEVAPVVEPETPAAEDKDVNETEPVKCEVNVVAPSVYCMRDVVEVINYKDQTFSVCQYHLDQLQKSGHEYEVVRPT